MDFSVVDSSQAKSYRLTELRIRGNASIKETSKDMKIVQGFVARVRFSFVCVIFSLLVWGLLLSASVQAQFLVGQNGEGFYGGNVRQYSTSGQLLNGSFITGIEGPWGIAADDAGAVYVWDYYGTVRKYSGDGTLLNNSLISGQGVSYGGMTFHNGSLYLTEWSTRRIAQYTTSGAIVNASLVSGLDYATKPTFGGNGNMYVLLAGKISEYTPTGSFVKNINISGLAYPGGLAMDQNYFYISDYGLNKILKYTLGGTLVSSALITGLQSPGDIYLDGDGGLYVINRGGGAIGKYSTTGVTINSSFVSGLTTPLSFVVVPEPATITVTILGLVLCSLGRSGKLQNKG